MIQAKIRQAANLKQSLNEELATDMSHVEEEDCEPPIEDQENYRQEFKTEDDEN